MKNEDLMIDHYLKEEALDNNQISYDAIDYPSTSVDQAITWSHDALRTIIIPTNTLDELEELWIKFNGQILKNRRESDWKSLELFGINNQTHYEFLKSKFLTRDIPDDPDEDPLNTIHPYMRWVVKEHFEGEPEIVPDNTYTDVEIEKALDYQHSTGYTMITPTKNLDDLETQWSRYNSMILKHRRESDWASMDIFGISNQQHYEKLKSCLLKKDIPDITDEFNEYERLLNGNVIGDAVVSPKYVDELVQEGYGVDASKIILEAIAHKPSTNYEDAIVSNVVTNIVDGFGDLYDDIETTDVPSNDVPFLTPDEMIDMGVFNHPPTENYYGEPADNEIIDEELTTKKWFESYNAMYHGFGIAPYSYSGWVRKVRELSLSYSRTHNPATAQSLLELGWPAGLPFNEKNRLYALNRQKRILEARSSKTDIIDLTKMDADPVPDDVLQEALATGSHLHPIFIVLSEGNTAFSAAIKTLTHSHFSHASISLDPSLEHMYSFGVKGTENRFGGFIEENYKDVPGKLGLFSIFVKDEQFQKIKDMIETFKQNVNKTVYGFVNILTYLFHIPFNRDYRMICSQFVDRMLKIADIDLTHTDPALVAPATFQKVAKNNNKIYQLYEGIAKRYNSSRIKRIIDNLLTSHKAQPIKEALFYMNETNFLYGLASNIHNITTLRALMEHRDLVKDPRVNQILDKVITPCLEAQIYREVKEFPVQFDDDGNLFIRKMQRINFEAEYAKSHRLLREYEKAANMEGMKYELAKLWMMNEMIEQKLYNRAKNKAVLNRARAKILNDFKYYLKIVHSIDSQWNFQEYYESTPFSSAVVKVNAPTLKTFGKLAKETLKSVLF